jgi:hypothetical protein
MQPAMLVAGLEAEWQFPIHLPLPEIHPLFTIQEPFAEAAGGMAETARALMIAVAVVSEWVDRVPE